MSEQFTEEAISTVEDSINKDELPTRVEPERETKPTDEVTESAKDETIEPDAAQADPEKHIPPKEPPVEATETATDPLVSDAKNEQSIPDEPTAKQENYME